MKYIYITILSIVLLASCGEKKEPSIAEVIATNDLTQIKTKKAELDKKQQKLSREIELLSAEISKRDINKKVSLVSTIKVKEQKFSHYLELLGNVQTKQNILVSPEANGMLKSVLVSEGQYVNEGETLGEIEDNGISNQLEQLKIQASLAKTTYERQERMWSQKIGSEIQFLQVKSNYEAQKSAVAQLEKSVEKLNIKAPFSGVVDDVIIDQGNLVNPGMEVFRIVNLKEMYIETEVPESYITSIKKGKSVEVEFPVLGKSINSKIHQVGNFINPINRTFKVEILVSNKKGNIKPNLTAKLKINDYTNLKAILIPQSIISENAKGQQFVYVIKNKNANKEAIAERVIIKTGKTQGGVIEVLANLPVGTEVIQEGARSVNNGQTVRVVNK